MIGIKENLYFQAAQAIGSPPWRTVLRHVLPNVLAPIIVIFSITIGAVIITEASLSFLGFGLPLSVPSWGGLLSREGRNYMQVVPLPASARPLTISGSAASGPISRGNRWGLPRPAACPIPGAQPRQPPGAAPIPGAITCGQPGHAAAVTAAPGGRGGSGVALLICCPKW